MGYFLDTDWDKVVDDIDSTNIIEKGVSVFEELPFDMQVEEARAIVNSPQYAQFHGEEAHVSTNDDILKQSLEFYNYMVRIINKAEKNNVLKK